MLRCNDVLGVGPDFVFATANKHTLTFDGVDSGVTRSGRAFATSATGTQGFDADDGQSTVVVDNVATGGGGAFGRRGRFRLFGGGGGGGARALGFAAVVDHS